MGFRATGGAAFLDVELLVDVERRRSAGFGGGVGLFAEGGGLFKGVFEGLRSSEVTEDEGLDRGGRLRVPFVADEVDGREEPCGAGIRGTVTQSGSSLRLYGFEGLFGLGTAPF